MENDQTDFKAALKRLFEFDGGNELLNDAVATNVLMFKSNRLRGDHELSWSQIPKDIRRQAKSFCKLEFDYILDLLKPQKILVVGLNAADRIINQRRSGGTTSLFRQKNPRHRLIVQGSIGSIPAIGICHITGSRISTDDKARMSAWLTSYFAKQP